MWVTRYSKKGSACWTQTELGPDITQVMKPLMNKAGYAYVLVRLARNFTNHALGHKGRLGEVFMCMAYWTINSNLR